MFAVTVFVFFAGTAGARGTTASGRRSRLRPFRIFRALGGRALPDQVLRVAVDDLVNEVIDVFNACGSEIGVGLLAVGRSITYLPFSLEPRSSFRSRCKDRWGAARSRRLYAIELFGRRGSIVSGRFEEGATAEAPGSLYEFADERFVEGPVGHQAGVPGGAEFFVNLVFVRTDEGGG
jgi:hypothetical protein